MKIDVAEQIALDLDKAQMKRYADWVVSKSKVDFWTEFEMTIHRKILYFRLKSTTFHPDNKR